MSARGGSSPSGPYSNPSLPQMDQIIKQAEAVSQGAGPRCMPIQAGLRYLCTRNAPVGLVSDHVTAFTHSYHRGVFFWTAESSSRWTPDW